MRRAVLAGMCVSAAIALCACGGGDDPEGADEDGGAAGLDSGAGGRAGTHAKAGRGGVGAGGTSGQGDTDGGAADGGAAEDGAVDGGGGGCNCGPSPNPCATTDCVAGKCVERLGGPVDPSVQVEGDCKQLVCGEAGLLAVANEDDVEDDGNACTVDACDGTTPTHEPTAARSACSDGDATLCDGEGACAECVDESDCDGTDACKSGQCVPAGCMNGGKDGDETDTDCGGSCDPCGPGKGCSVNGDCTGNECGGGNTCVPNCADGVQNDAETDVDCGGGSCGDCADGDGCGANADCSSGLCWETACVSELNGCTPASATDRTSMAGATITQSGNSYTPACLRVSAGTVVTISNTSATHPFVGGRVVGTTATPTASGPFAGTRTSGPAMFTMSEAGNFPYYCSNHFAAGMKGTVFVVP